MVSAAGKGHFRLPYTPARTETAAVLSVLSYSNCGTNGGTNVMRHCLGCLAA
jgi:hypothetical protein